MLALKVTHSCMTALAWLLQPFDGQAEGRVGAFSALVELLVQQLAQCRRY